MAALEMRKAEREQEERDFLHQLIMVAAVVLWPCHETSLPAFKHTPISQHTMQQVSAVKTKKYIIINVY